MRPSPLSLVIRVLPRLLTVLAVALIAWQMESRAIALLPIDYDEDDYLRAGQLYANDFHAGNLADLLNDNYRPEHPQLTKILYGIVLTQLPQAAPPPAVPSTANPNPMLPRNRLDLLRDTAGLFGVLEVAAIAIVSPLAGLLLATDSWQIKYTSEVMLEAVPAFFSLLAVLLYALSDRKRRRWLIASGVALGLAAAGKYLYAIAGIAILLDWLAATRPAIDLQASQPVLRTALRWIRPIAGWGLLSLAVFFLANPYLWPDPIGRLAGSIAFHWNYTNNAPEIQQAGYPMGQQLIWLVQSVPWSPQAFVVRIDFWLALLLVLAVPQAWQSQRVYAPLLVIAAAMLIVWNPSDLMTRLDLWIAILAVLGLPALWHERRVYALWLLLGVGFLIVWPTKWPQYLLIVTAPLSLSAATALRVTIGGWIAEQLREAGLLGRADDLLARGLRLLPGAGPYPG